jgi:cellulose synthase operon protein C
MRQLLLATLLIAAPAFAQAKPAAKRETRDAQLKKDLSAAPDKSLAGDLTRKKSEKTEAAPSLHYDQYRLGVELQVASKRRQQIEDLQKIIQLSPDKREKPGLLFRLGELYWEESKHFFFEGNRKDDEYIRAMNANDKAGQAKAKAEKEQLLTESKRYAKLATDQYSTIVQQYKDYERTDEVLYFLGHNLLEQGDERKALVAFKRLIDKFPKSKFLPDAYLAFGEYYFNNSKGKRDMLEKALGYYKLAEAFPENQVYAFAIYKQGWCYFNLAEYEQAMDKYKAVILYGEYAGEAAVQKAGTKGSLIREARADYVRSYGRSTRSALDARADFAKVAPKEEDRFAMMKGLANLYYEDGKDKEAALTYNTLIKEKPLSPEAPGWQGKIVDCVLRAGNKKMTVDQVRRLVKIMEEVTKSGVVKEDKDKKALDEARELSERTLSNLAVTWHNEAKKTRDEETFRFANEVYSDYLTLFPENPKAYDLRFFWSELLNDNLQRFDRSAEEYSKVFLWDIAKIEKKEKPGKWLNNAAYNAVLAYDEVVKKAESSGKLKTETATDVKQKLKIAPERQALLDACERYLKYIQGGDKRVEIAFKAANIYYRHNFFEESVKTFADIALNHTDYKFENGDRAAEVAANLILDSYNLLGDWAKVNEWSRKFYNEPKLATGKFREDLAQLIEQSSFKLVNQLEADKKYAEAAEAYLTFVSEFPKSALADKALFNASIDFFNAKLLDRALETRKRIIAQYPNSPFVPACIYANAEGAELIGDFEEAADSFELYVRGYEKSLGGAPAAKKGMPAPAKKGGKAPKGGGGSSDKQVWEESKAQIALFNAGVFREGLGQYKQALKNRERYLELWPKSKDAEAVFLSIADLHEKNGVYGKALAQLETYQKDNMKDPSKVLTSEGRILAIYDEKLRRPKDVARMYKRIWDFYDKLPSRLKKGLDNTALDAVARAHLALSEDDRREYHRIKIKWGPNPAPHIEFKKTLQEKAKGLEVVQKRYTQTVGFKAGEPAICALFEIGNAYAHMADSLINAPMPKGAPEELQDAIREEMSNQAMPVKDKAAEAYAAAVQKGQELDLYSACFRKSLDILRATRPETFPPMSEEYAEIRSPVTTMAVGGDLLTSIQPVPVITKEQAVENQQKAKELQGDLADLGQQVQDRPKDLEPTLPASGKGPKRKSTDEEPEDLL